MLYPHLYLAAFGTIGDGVSLRAGENRWLVRNGLKALTVKGYGSVGAHALFRRARVDVRTMCEHAVAWQIGPRINAVGRISDPMIACRLLMEHDVEEAEALAAYVEARRTDVRALTSRVQAEAMQQALELGTAPERAAFVLWGETWPASVVGVVAGRVAEAFGRPAVLLGREGDHWVGGARAGGAPVHLRDLLAEAAPGHLAKFGGHAGAAGMLLLGSGVAEAEAFRTALVPHP